MAASSTRFAEEVAEIQNGQEPCQSIAQSSNERAEPEELQSLQVNFQHLLVLLRVTSMCFRQFLWLFIYICAMNQYWYQLVFSTQCFLQTSIRSVFIFQGSVTTFSIDQDAADPFKIAMKAYNLKLGSYYTHKPQKVKYHDNKLWQLTKVEADSAHFVHQPLIGPQETKTVDHEELKRFRAYDKELPQLFPAADLDALKPQLSTNLEKEMLTCEAQMALYQNYFQHLACILIFSVLHAARCQKHV